MGVSTKDGLLSFPYTQHDTAIIILAIAGFLYRMYLMHRTPDVKNPQLRDWAGMFVLTVISTVILYEFAIYRKMAMQAFYPVFALAIILVKDISDWLFMSKEGKAFVLATLKEMVTAALGKIGFVKKD